MIAIERARKLVRRFKGKRILVVGDLMLDRYIWGSVSRISPEAPVPVVQVEEESAMPGGAANVAFNIQALGGTAIVAGLMGRDESGQALLSVLKSAGMSVEGVLADSALRTTVKTRVVAERQQVVRFDHEDGPDVAATRSRRFCHGIARLAPQADGIIIEDYGKGAVNQTVADAVMEAAKEAGIGVGYDPKEDHPLDVTGLALATPNFREACSAAGIPARKRIENPLSDPRLAEAGAILVRKWNPDLLIITLGPHGMYLRRRGKAPLHIPTKAREVYDVSGAGDTVIATAMLALAAGAAHEEAAHLANYAAGVVVGKLGTATCSPAELLAAVQWGNGA